MRAERDDSELLLAAEDCEEQLFRELSVFSPLEEGILRRLIAHGPVLLRGARGSGKSTLLREAALRLQRHEVHGANAVGVYVSLRHLPLLTSRDREYEEYFYRFLIPAVARAADRPDFAPRATTADVQEGLSELAGELGRRIVLLFDDAAHIGRDAPRTEFFDLFRTLSGSRVSCKAAIYPGVTNFGQRFDVYNDATVLDLARNEAHAGFGPFFEQVLVQRFGAALPSERWIVPRAKAAEFVARAVLGNVRAFVFVCNRLLEACEREPLLRIGVGQLGETLIAQAREYFWPLIEEVRPKLGRYESMVAAAQTLAEGLYAAAAEARRRSVVILREHVERLAKPLEILEYCGFVTRREASIGMKSAGRGARFSLNLCNLLERMPGSRLTSELFDQWMERDRESLELHRGIDWLRDLSLPEARDEAALTILGLPLETLRKSNAYPYGLTDARVAALHDGGFHTIADLAGASREALDAVPTIGEQWVNRIQAVVGQAVWM